MRKRLGCATRCACSRAVREVRALVFFVALCVASMLRAAVFVVLRCCSGAVAGVQPVLNVIAEPALAADSVEFTDAFRDVSVAAGELARHAGERRQALDESVGALMASQVLRSSSAKGTQPMALLGADSVSATGGIPELHILPPAQNDEDVLAELDGVMQGEQAKRKLADELFAGDKQRMLDIEKAELRRIIRDVFA